MPLIVHGRTKRGAIWYRMLSFSKPVTADDIRQTPSTRARAMCSAWANALEKPGDCGEPDDLSSRSVREGSVRFALPHHLAAVGVKRVVDDPLGRVELVIVLEAEVTEAFGDRF